MKVVLNEGMSLRRALRFSLQGWLRADLRRWRGWARHWRMSDTKSEDGWMPQWPEEGILR